MRIKYALPDVYLLHYRMFSDILMIQNIPNKIDEMAYLSRKNRIQRFWYLVLRLDMAYDV